MVALGPETVQHGISRRGGTLAEPSGHKPLLYYNIEAYYGHGKTVGAAHIDSFKPEAVYFQLTTVVHHTYNPGARGHGVGAERTARKQRAGRTLILRHGGGSDNSGGYKGRYHIEFHRLKYRAYNNHSTKISTKNRHRQMAPSHITSRLWHTLRDSYLWPRLCPVCGEEVPPDSVMCTLCLMKLPVCMEKGYELLESRAMATNAILPVSTVRAWFHYDPDDSYAELLRVMKYDGRSKLGHDMGRLFARELMASSYQASELPFAEVDVLLPMPMYRSKRLLRGYNQSEVIARGMAAVSGAAVGDNLVAVRSHGTQTRLSQAARRRNISGCFALRHPEELAGLNVAIVDDIITTGASMGEALKALSDAIPGIASVSLYALGATRRKGY